MVPNMLENFRVENIRDKELSTWGDGEFAGDKYVGEFLKGKRSGLGTYNFF